MLGRYVVLGELGSGAMGTVLKAYDETLDRTVAIKLLHTTAADRHPAWLEREALALGRLSHPNVVHVYELGQAEGQWFIAMELVGGQTLREWQRPRHGWRESLEVYLQAGDGLAAAHAAGLVHRDFKPDNCLIDERGHVRVLDFGLAGGAVVASSDEVTEATEAMGHRVLEETLASNGRIVGTPAYMPPEQMRGEDADPRSDQFSFCVALYEAVYGERPYAGRTLATLMAAILAGDVGERPARARAPAQLRKILLRGLAAEPDRRWPAMDVLLAELRTLTAPKTQHWLALGVTGGLVVVGVGLVRYAEVGLRCDGAEEQLEEIWNETRKQEVRGAILETGASYAADTWARVEPRLDEYAAAWIDQYTSTCEATAIRGEQSESLRDLRMSCLHERKAALVATVDVLAHTDHRAVENAVDVVHDLPELEGCSDATRLSRQQQIMPLPSDASTRQAIDDLRSRLTTSQAERTAGSYQVALEGVDSLIPDAEAVGYEPLLAEIRLLRGDLLDTLGRFTEAEDELTRAYTLAAGHGHDDVTIDSLIALAHVIGSKRGEYRAGLRLARMALPLAEHTGTPIQRSAGSSMLGTLLASQGLYQEAEAHHRRALEIINEALSVDHPAMAPKLNNLGLTLLNQGRHQDAELSFRQAIELRERTLGSNHPDVAGPVGNLGLALEKQGRYREAEQQLQRALRIRETAFGPDHPSISESLSDLGLLLDRQGRYEEAEQQYRRSLGIWELAMGSTHPDTAVLLLNLGNSLASQGRDAEAELQHRRAIGILEQSVEPDHPSIAESTTALASSLANQGRYDEAMAQYRRALDTWETGLGMGHPNAASTLNNMGAVLESQGKHEEAGALYQRAIRIWRDTLGPDHPIMATGASNLGSVLEKQGRHEDARPLYEQALHIWELTLGDAHPDVAYALVGLARVELAKHELGRARSLAARAVTIRETAKVAPGLVAEARFVLARALWPNRAQRDRALALAEQAREVWSQPEWGGDFQEELGDVEQWLAEHGVG